MPTQDGYPSATVLGQWTLVGAATHHAAVSDVYPPGDTTSRIYVVGFTGAKMMKLKIPKSISGDYARVTNCRITFYIQGVAITHTPAMRVWLYVNGLLMGYYLVQASSAGYDSRVLDFPMDMDKVDFDQDNIELWFDPIEVVAGEFKEMESS